MYKSLDGGETWTDVTPTPNQTYSSIFMFNENQLFLLKSGNIILSSTNQGNIWQTYTILNFFEPSFDHIYFVDSTTGFAFDARRSMIKTTDCGITWIKVLENYFDDLWIGDVKFKYNAGIVLDYFKSEKKDLGKKYESYDSILYTTDKGTNWTRFRRPNYYPLYSVDFLSDSSFIISGESGGLYRSNDYGRTLSNMTNRVNSTGYSSFTLVSKDIWYFTYLDDVFRTTNGGKSFTKNLIGSTFSSDTYAFNKDTAIICVYNDQCVYKTYNGGLSWIRINIPDASDYMNNLCFPNNGNIGYMSTYAGIFRTDDYGESWINIFNKSSNNVDFVDENNGWMVNNPSGNIYHTQDGGKNWDLQYDQSGGYYLRMIDKNVGFGIAFDHLSRTTNGGENWDTISFPFAISVSQCVAFKLNDTARIYVGSQEGFVYYSIDTGKTWIKDDIYTNGLKTADLAYKDGFLVCAIENGAIFTKILSNSIVPVELTSFTSTISKNSVTIKWSTATEKNNYGFEIERKDLKSEFKRIGFIKGKGTTTELSNYSYSDNNLAPNAYNYRIKQIDYDGNYQYYYLANEVNLQYMLTYSLEQNYPNPFNPSTTIKYAIAKAGIVTLKLYDILGKEKEVLVNERKEPGNYVYEFKNLNLSSGVYFYTLKTNDYIQTKKMVVLK